MHSLKNYSKILYSDVELYTEFENIHSMQTYFWQAMGDNGLATAQLGSINTTYNSLSYFNKTEFLYIYSLCEIPSEQKKQMYKPLVGRWCDGRCQEVGGEKLECCKE